MRVLLVATALLSAGCAESEAPGGTPTGTDDEVVPGPSTLDWRLEDCLQIGTNLFVDPATLQARVPDGFVVTTLPDGTAVLGIEGFACNDATIGNHAGEVHVANVWTLVTPPASMQVPDARHYMRLHVALSGTAWPEAMSLSMLETGSVSTTSQPAPAPIEGAIAFSQLGTTNMQGATSSSFSPFEYEFVDFFGGPAGLEATLRGNLSAASFHSGYALVELPANSWIAAAVGTPQTVSNVWWSEVTVVGQLAPLMQA